MVALSRVSERQFGDHRQIVFVAVGRRTAFFGVVADCGLSGGGWPGRISCISASAGCDPQQSLVAYMVACEPTTDRALLVNGAYRGVDHRDGAPHVWAAG